MLGEYTKEQKELVLKLREETMEGAFTCVRALIDNDWNYDKAYEDLKNRPALMRLI